MATKAQHIFIGMDTDTADRFLPEGSFRDALNVHIGSSESDGVRSVENVKGNTLVSYSLPSGTNQIIGSHEDIVNKCVYYFLANYTTINISSTSGSTVTTSSAHGLVLSDLVNITGISGRTNILGKWIVAPVNATSFNVLNPLTYITPSLQTITLTGTSGASGIITKYSHSILKYDAVANSISLVYKHSRLNFDANYPVSGTALINGVLHWADAYNPPRSLDLSEAAGYGTFFIEPMVDFIRIPPTKPCSLVGRWVNSDGNDIPYSTDPASPNNKQPNSMNDKEYQFIYRYVYFDDSKSVWSPTSTTIGTGFVDARKNRIDVTISNAETNDLAYYSKVIKNIEIGFCDNITKNFKYAVRVAFPTSVGVVTYSFYNDVAYSLIDTAETSKYFDSVPKIAGSLSSVNNRVFQGDCTEGFDVDPTTFSGSNVTYSGLPNLIRSNAISWKMFSDYEIGIVFYDRADRKSGVYKLVKANGPANDQRKVIPSFTLIGRPPIWATHYQIVRSNNLTKDWFIQGYKKLYRQVNNTTEIVFNGQNGELYYSPQAGDIIFQRALDTGSPTVYSNPTKYKVIGSGVNDLGEQTIIIAGNATEIYYSLPNAIVEIYSPSVSKDQFFYEIGYMAEIKDPGTANRSFFSTGSTVGIIDLSTVVSGDIYQRRLNDAFLYHSSTVIEVTDVARASTLVIVGVNGANFVLTSASATILDAANRLIALINASQFYRASLLPPQDQAQRFIIYDSRDGSQGNITITLLLNGVSEVTDSNYSGAEAQQEIDRSLVESMSNNDNDLAWSKNIGRANAVLQNGDKEERRESLVRFGGRFINNTSINLVNSFDSLDQEPLSNNGAIRKLITASNNQAEGTVLLAVQDNEISSLYIGQVVIKNAGGGQNVAVTDKVIGTVNPLQKLVGSINPESIVQHNGTVYGFDSLRGIVWRYGQDGLNFLSDLGMKSFFYKRSQYLLTLSSFKCYAGIDPYHNEYVLTIPNTDPEKQTVVWSEAFNRWTSFMRYAGEWYQKINTQMVSFVSGALWLHRSNSAYNNFYGIQYTSKLKFVCNKEPSTTKILQVVEERSTSVWDCTDIATPEGQSSELLGLQDISTPNVYPQDFRKYDNTTYVGIVLRDKNTPALQSSDYPLLTGDVIRSDVFSVLMENSKTTQENLYFVNLMYVPSYKKS